MMKKSLAFTLGEVLIALGVIGVVASLVLPQMIVGKKASEAKAGFNTAYSILSKAVTEMDSDNIPVLPASYTVFDSDNPNFYEQLKKYQKVTIDCGNGGSNPDACMDGSGKTSPAYRSLDGGSPADLGLFGTGGFVINNGMLVVVGNPGGTTTNSEGKTVPSPIYIAVDINGKNKLPNKLGFDFFVFELTKNGVLPYGSPDTSAEEDADSECDFESGSGPRNGMTCAFQALSDPDYFTKVFKGH